MRWDMTRPLTDAHWLDATSHVTAMIQKHWRQKDLSVQTISDISHSPINQKWKEFICGVQSTEYLHLNESKPMCFSSPQCPTSSRESTLVSTVMIWTVTAEVCGLSSVTGSLLLVHFFIVIFLSFRCHKRYSVHLHCNGRSFRSSGWMLGKCV